jgi:hypothetical protein
MSMRTTTMFNDYISDFAKPLLSKVKNYNELTRELRNEGIEVRAKGQIKVGDKNLYRTAFALVNGNRYKNILNVQNAIETKIKNALARTMNESKNSENPEEVEIGLAKVKKSDIFKKQLETLTGTKDDITGTFVVYMDPKMAELQLTNY